LKHIAKITLPILSILFSFSSFAQVCERVAAIEICDMTIIDSSAPAPADGMLNLYTEYQNQFPAAPALQSGTWIAINPEYQAALTGNGDLRLWDLPIATTATLSDDEKYIFEMRNVACGTDIALTLELILGPYSGLALPPLVNGANIEVCDTEVLDLYNTLFTNEPNGIPAAHQNGVWSYNGTSPNVTTGNLPLVTFEIPDDPNSLIDQETFEFTYTVTGIAPCNPPQSTTVKVSAVRDPDAGEGTENHICEDDVKDGVYDADISLLSYISGQDPNGSWSTTNDFTTQLNDANDTTINLAAMYADMIVRRGVQFGEETFTFTYSVRDRSNKCNDDFADVTFTFYEELRPFSQQIAPPEFCANATDTFNLYDLITFETEGGLLFEYDDDMTSDWVLQSTTATPVPGSSADLRLLSAGEVDPMDPTRVYSHLGMIYPGDFGNPTAPGTYVYRYTIFREHCPDFSTDVTIQVNPFDYAGENTPSDPTMIPEFCESDSPIDLVSVLETNGATVATSGVWTDALGAVVPNSFVTPTIANQQDFSFTYTITTADSCMDSSTLTIRVFEDSNTGTPSDGEVCREQGTFELFSLLTNANENGFWTGPVGYNSQADLNFDAHLGHLNLLDVTKNWQSGEYSYIIAGNGACQNNAETIVNLTIVEEVSVSFNLNNRVFCKDVGQVNLFDFLDDTASPLDGEFIRTDDGSNAVLENGAFVFEELEGAVYDFRYTVINGSCNPVINDIAIRIIDVRPPDEVLPTEFCVLEAATLNEITTFNYVETDGSTTPITDNLIWYAAPEGEETVPLSTLLVDGQKFYVAAQGETGCESKRLEVPISILNLGEGECTLEFQDGVAPSTTGANNTFNLTDWKQQVFNIPVVFSEFELLIYNRFGTLVYRGNKNTEEFRGIGNTGVQLGKNVPTGVYFYVFNPNKDDNKPIQGNFYLSK